MRFQKVLLFALARGSHGRDNGGGAGARPEQPVSR